MRFLAPAQNTRFWAPRKKVKMCLISWKRTQKMDPHKLFRGDLGSKRGSQTGHFSATKRLVYCFFLPLLSENPHAHKNKIGTSTPLLKNPRTPPKGGILWAWGFSSRKNQKMPGAHKIGAAISGPRITGGNFMDTTFFLILITPEFSSPGLLLSDIMLLGLPGPSPPPCHVCPRPSFVVPTMSKGQEPLAKAWQLHGICYDQLTVAWTSCRAKGDGPKVTEPNLQFPTVFCEFSHALQMLEFPGLRENLRKSAVLCENLHFGFSLSP